MLLSVVVFVIYFTMQSEPSRERSVEEREAAGGPSKDGVHSAFLQSTPRLQLRQPRRFGLAASK